MNRATRLGVIASISTCCGIATLGFHSFETLPAKELAGQATECVGCQHEKLGWAPTGDRDIDNANLAVIQATLKARNELQLKQARDERLRQMTVWQGTALVPAPNSGASDKELYQSMAERFAELATPESRNADFAWCSQEGFRLVGWFGVVVSVEESEGGWNVVIRIQPKLMHADHSLVYSCQASTETWWIPRDGEARIVNSDPGKFTGLNSIQIN